jgi:hypothetical protein
MSKPPCKQRELEVGQAWFFSGSSQARVGLGLHTLGSGMKNLLNKFGFSQAWALLHKWKKSGFGSYVVKSPSPTHL